MWTIILNLYPSSSEARNLVPKEKLRNIRMGKYEPIILISPGLHRLARVGKTVLEEYLVSAALLGLQKSWDDFYDAMSGR